MDAMGTASRIPYYLNHFHPIVLFHENNFTWHVFALLLPPPCNGKES